MLRTKRETAVLRNLRETNRPIAQVIAVGGFGILCIIASLVLNGCAHSPGKPLTNEEMADLRIDIALSAASAGDTVTAYQRLKEAEDAAPKYWKIPFTRSLVHLKRKDLASALAESKRAVVLAPDQPDANNNLGKLLIDAGQYDQAEPYLKKSAASILNKDPQQANTNLGILSFKKGKVAEAKQYLRLAIEMSPKNACAAYYYRGQIFLREKRLEEAVKFFEKATKNACGQFKEPHLAIGIALAESKKWEQARAKFLEVSQLFPDTPIAEEALERLKFLP